MPEPLSISQYCPIRRVGAGPGHHFFGYYNKHPWDYSGRYLLAQRVPMFSADLTGKESAEVGFFDLQDNDRFYSVGETSAWNWQMGSQLQWLQGKTDRQLIYNSRAEAADANSPYPDFCSTVYSLETQTSRQLPLPVYVVAPNSEWALCVDYSRFQVTHPTIGYAATRAEPELANAPGDDGIYRMDIESGDSQKILSLQDLRDFQPLKSMDHAIHWVTHLEINPASTRFLFIHRWTERVEDETCFLHRLFSANPDGSDLRLLECTDHPLPQLEADFDVNAVGTFDYEKSEYQISHPAWKNDQQIIVGGPHKGAIHYHLYDELTDNVAVIGEDSLTENGHMTYSTDGKWILSDTYPDSVSNERLLILYDVENNRRYDIGSFYTDPNLGKPNRCDLHPRWNPDSRQVCIDSVHEHVRQMYLIDVSRLTA
jgi:hypothetical protein